MLEEVDTDDSGNTEKITLDAPPLEYSMEPGKTSRMRNIRSRCMPQAIGTLRFRRSISCPGRCNAGSGDGGAGCRAID